MGYKQEDWNDNLAGVTLICERKWYRESSYDDLCLAGHPGSRRRSGPIIREFATLAKAKQAIQFEATKLEYSHWPRMIVKAVDGKIDPESPEVIDGQNTMLG